MGWVLGLEAMFETPAPPCDAHAFTDLLASLTPEAWWKLDETSGTTAVDSSGNGHDGTYQTGVRLAERPGPCAAANYLNCVPNGPAVIVPDAAEFSLPNDLTVVIVSSYIGATVGPGTGGANVDLIPVNKYSEWYVSQHQTRTPSVVELNTTVTEYYQLYQTSGGGTFADNWRLHITTIPASGNPLMWVNNVSKGDTPSGPSGTRQGNTTGALWLGYGVSAVATPGPTRGRFLAHVAIFDRILDSTERGDLWTAFDADDWESV